MYSTCLFCSQPLGRNEAIEGFPVGTRVAADALPDEPPPGGGTRGYLT